MEKVKVILEKRAWFMHLVMNLSRLIYPILNVSTWQKAYRQQHQIENLNTEFSEKNEQIIKIAIMVAVVMGFLLNILVWFRNKYASWLLNFEILYLILVSFAPINYGSLRNQTLGTAFIV